MVLYIYRGNPHLNFLILEQFSASCSFECILCLLVLRSSMSGHNAISIVLLMRFLYSCCTFQMEIALGSIAPTIALPCQASVDSILDYGQYVILSTGNFLCSAPTINSTMDFSVKPIEEGVVDSPPNSKLRLPISCSPSPLRLMDRLASSMSPGSCEKGTQRKLYGVESISIDTATRTSKANQIALPLPTTTSAVAPTRQRVSSSLHCRCKRPKKSGSFSTVASTPSYDFSENRSLQVQRQQQLLEYGGQIQKRGYNRGPEILKAMEKLRSASYS